MIQIFLGDDIGESRRKFVDLKKEYRDKGYEIFEIRSTDIEELDKWLYESTGLFFDKKVFFAENILSDKKNRQALEKYDSKQAKADIIIWEELLDPKKAKSFFQNGKIITAKLPDNIFKFLDSVCPGNLTLTFDYLNRIVDRVDQNIILFMLQRRVRDLILIKNGLASKRKLAAWQISKLKNQARNWTPEQLISFYDSLFRIEVSSKTSQNYYSIKKSLDIIFCFFI